MAAIVAKHSVQTLISVTRLRRGRLAWQHDPSVSTCQVSGSSSHMSTYSFVIIFLISLGGTEPKPGKSPRTAGAPGVVGAGVDTTAGHAGRADGPEAAPPPAEDMANMGNKTSEPARGAKQKKRSVGSCRYKGRRARACKRASGQKPALKQLLPPRGVAQGSGNPVP